MQPGSTMLLVATMWDTEAVRWTVWGGLIVLTVAVLFLMRTRWGQSQPLGKCVVLSLLAHLLLGIYLTTVNIVSHSVGTPEGKGISVSLVEGGAGDPQGLETPAHTPFDASATFDPLATIDASLPPLPDASGADLSAGAEPQRALLESSAAGAVAGLAASMAADIPPLEEVAAPLVASEPIARAAAREAAAIESTTARDAAVADPVPPPELTEPDAATMVEVEPRNESSASAISGAGGAAVSGGGQAAGVAAGVVGGVLAGVAGGGGKPNPPPKALQQRMGDHLQAARGRGATEQSEASVKSALDWLAANQSENGRWEPRRLGGGAGRASDGEYREAAGAHADTGITGLALLAFLAGGHTHLQGDYQTTVRRGLEFLLNSQDGDGCLGAKANQFERMYCHAMATCALSEALAMTADRRLEPSVRRAIQYTVRSQDRLTGGWRYHPATPGDTSQLGWQVMSLKSAELGGIAMSSDTRDGIARFLQSVATGRGGLARYQANRGNPSRSMTAEALACRQFMGLRNTPESINEASAFVLQDTPGASVTNHYYWYYATLALFQLQGESWRRWNESLQKNLLETQRRDGELAGSWDPDPVWGPCGGRVYSTSLATLCLEVYYRFLPLYVEAAGLERRTK